MLGKSLVLKLRLGGVRKTAKDEVLLKKEISSSSRLFPPPTGEEEKSNTQRIWVLGMTPSL